MNSFRRLILSFVLLALAGALFVIAGPVFAQGPNPPVADSAAGPAEPSAAPASPDAASPLGTTFTYQGQLKRQGSPYEGICDLQFSLWDQLAGGSQQGNFLLAVGVQVAAGQFTVRLDFGNLFTGDARWLETAVKCSGDGEYTILVPRQPLDAVPYALGLRPGAQAKGSLAGTAGIMRATNSGQGAALVGLATSDKGVTYGVLGNAFSPDGYAVWGYADGGATGVRGASAAGGPGVSGTSATGWGVYGEGGGAGVVGVTSTQYNPAVYGEHRGTGGIGVKGKAANGAGVAGESTSWYGVFGKSTQQVGVWGETNAAHTFDAAGVSGVSNGDGGIGVKGTANVGGGAYGVYGVSAHGAGVVGQSGAANASALWGKNTAGGIAVNAEGSAIQSRDKGGFVKAMALVQAGGHIATCYNGVTGASGNGCGFTAQWTRKGDNGDDSDSVVDFGFPIADRFVVANLINPYGIDHAKAFNLRFLNGSQVTLLNWDQQPGLIGSPGARYPNDFFIVVY